MERSEERGFTLDVCSSDEGGKTWKRQKMKQNSSSNFQKAPTQLLSGTELKLSVSFYSQTFINCLRNIRRNKDRTRTKDQRIIFYSDKKIQLFYQIQCGISNKKNSKNHNFMEWISFQGELEVTPTSFIHFLILQRHRFNTWVGLLHVWYICFVRAACSGFLFLCITTRWRRHVTTGGQQSFVLDPLLLSHSSVISHF